jgi:hypothetical protein
VIRFRTAANSVGNGPRDHKVDPEDNRKNNSENTVIGIPEPSDASAKALAVKNLNAKNVAIAQAKFPKA